MGNQREKVIQDNQQLFFEKNANVKIYEENERKEFDLILQEDPWLLIQPLPSYFNGLKDAIIKLNAPIFNNHPDTQKEDIVELILNDVKHQYKTLTPIQLWDYIFDIDGNDRKIIIDTKTKKEITYNLVDLVNPVNNELIIIKEKRVEYQKIIQKPDFAIYINGLPMFIVETKTEKTGLEEAAKDARTKHIYKNGKFLGILGATNDDAFLSMNPKKATPYYWKAYGNNKGLGKNGFEDLFLDIILDKTNLIFYLRHSVFISKDSIGNEMLMNHRCQQFYTLKKMHNVFYQFESNQVPFRKLIKHVQRSGKSITMRSIVFLMLSEHPNLFKKIVITTPDLTIRREIINTFNGDMMANGTCLKEINSRSELIKEIEKDSKTSFVYMTNIQQLEVDYSKIKQYQKNDILFIIDEAHTHQGGMIADFRDAIFKKASYVAVTATPKMEENRGVLQDKTNINYNEDNKEYLDEFNASDALDLGIIVPIKYMKTKFKEILDQEIAVKFDMESQSKIKNFIEADSEIQQNINDEIELYREKLLSQKLKAKDIDEKVEKKLKSIIEKHENALQQFLNEEAMKEIRVDLIDSKIEYIIKDVKSKREKVFFNPETHEPFFPTKGFWFVESIDHALKIVDKIKELSCGSLTYQGVRFAVDFSEREDGDTGKSLNVETINGGYVKGSLDMDFESEEDGSIDILVLVNKKLMGYNEPKIVTAYLDKYIREPAKLFQLVTRPATKLPNKPIGFVEDLTFGESNFKTYKKGLQWYDGSEDERFFLDDTQIDEQKENIRNAVNSILKLFNLTNKDDVNDNTINKLFGIMVDTTQFTESKVNTFFSRISEIKSAFKVLVTPRNYLDEIEHIFSIIKLAGKYRYEVLNKNTTKINFTPEEMKVLLDGILSALNIKSLEDISKYTIEGNTPRLLDEKREKIGYDTKLNKFKTGLNSVQPPLGNKKLYEELSRIHDELNRSDMADIENQKKLKDAEDKLKEGLSDIQKLINDKFKGVVENYIIDNILTEFISGIDLDLGDYQTDFINVCQKEIMPIVKNKTVENYDYNENFIKDLVDTELEKLRRLDSFNFNLESNQLRKIRKSIKSDEFRSSLYDCFNHIALYKRGEYKIG